MANRRGRTPQVLPALFWTTGPSRATSESLAGTTTIEGIGRGRKRQTAQGSDFANDYKASTRRSQACHILNTCLVLHMDACHQALVVSLQYVLST